MLVSYDATKDQLEIHWSDETGEPAEWRRARANVDLLVSEANESLGVAISAASWLVPELAKVKHNLKQQLIMQTWPEDRPAPPSLRGIPSGKNMQQQLPWDIGDIPRSTSLCSRRGICRQCGAVAPHRVKAVTLCGWPSQTECPDCSQIYHDAELSKARAAGFSNASEHYAASAKAERMLTASTAAAAVEYRLPSRTPNPHTGPRGRADKEQAWNKRSSTFYDSEMETWPEKAQRSTPATTGGQSPTSAQQQSTYNAATSLWSWTLDTHGPDQGSSPAIHPPDHELSEPGRPLPTSAR